MHGTVRTPSTAVEALLKIKEHIAEYLGGGLDREAESIVLGQTFGLNEVGIKHQWAKAKEEQAENERLNGFTEVHLEDLRQAVEVEEEEPKEAADRKVIEAAIAGAIAEPNKAEPIREARTEFDVAWIKARIAALAKPVEAEAKPEPEPEVEAEPEPRAALPALLSPPLPPAASEWDEAILALNEQHAIIESVGGGKAVIASWEPSDRDPTRLVVVYQTKESFLLRYSNRFVSWEAPGLRGTKTVVVPLGQYWLGARNRRQYRGVTFRPGGPQEVNNLLNLWQGWGVEATAGDWRLIRDHIEVVIAGGNKEFADYVIRWIAWSIQNPAAQAEVALVLIGLKGAGKGTLVRCLQRIFGAHAFQVTSREEVIGKFNGHLQDCVLFVADEAYWGGDKRCVGRLQGMITEPTLPIERKGFDLIQVPNFLHVVMLAEPGWVIPAGRYERRYAALAVHPVKRGDKAYFKALHNQIAEGGAEAMLYDLQKMDLGDWHPREIPEALLTNPAIQKQQGLTLPPLEQWYIMLLHNGVLPGALVKRPNTASTSALLDDVRARVPRLKFDLTEVGLRNFLLDEESIGIACTKFRSSAFNGWSFPPLAECRSAWERRYGPTSWDHAEMEEWSKK